MPPNLLSFCIASTYDVLPSPSNLKRWRICPESSCFLCGKEICTTAHVLGACKTSLAQGRFTYRHDLVLLDLVEILTSFTKELPSVPPKPANTISFVKAGKSVPKTKSKPNGILHLSNDWKLIADLNDGYVFPGHIALSSLRPDVVIFSNSLKRVILIELTCPCEENMENWHSTKLSKYSSLVNIITSNGWYVDLFAIEVGARGYCSRSVTICLKRLGLPNRLVFSSAKKLGQISMSSSFCIWLARNSREWSPDLPASKTTFSPLAANSSSKPMNSTKSDDHAANMNEGSLNQVGLINKGNTCYANSILQAFRVLPVLWSQWSSESSQLSSLVKAITLNMTILKRSSSPVDPSNFLRALERKIPSINNVPFNFNTQQDVPEILRIVLDELKGLSPIADSLLSTTLSTTLTCVSCFCSSHKEEKFDMLALSPRRHISSSFNHLLQTESLIGDDMWFCPQCSSKQNSTIDTKIINCGSVLIIQLKRFANANNIVFKDTSLVECLPCSNHILKVPIEAYDDISFSNNYSLVATINHSGSVKAGHYWAFIKDSVANVWLQCNDRSVLKVKPTALNNKTSYVLFYVRN